jgi:hypothetical protein
MPYVVGYHQWHRFIHFGRSTDMLTKNAYLLAAALGAGITALLFWLILTQTSGQHNQSIIQGSEPLTVIAAPSTNDLDQLTAIQATLDTIQTGLPQLNATLQHNQLANEKRLKQLEDDISQLKSLLAQPIEMPESGETVEADEFSLKREHVLAAERALAQVAAFDNALAMEVRDEGWAGEMENMIAIAAQNELYQGSSISSPSCKATFCRLEAFHGAMDNRDDFELIRRELPNSYHMQNFDLGDGSSKTVMYIIRQGEEPNNIIFNSLNAGVDGETLLN